MRDSSGSEERLISLKRPSSGSRGQALIIMAVSFIALGGMLGLAIDVGIAYFIQARLSQAVDAASLAGARSLARGSTTEEQAQNAMLVANRYFTANFPVGFWACTTQLNSDNRVDPGAVGSKIRRVYYGATATTPLYFLRLIGKTSATVAAKAVAQRRDANIVIVLDRSGSMSGSIGQLVDSAKWFVGQFAVGRDKVGLVTFGGTYNLIKPTINFTSDPTNVPDAIDKLTSATVYGTTNHAQPLWVAYQALADPAFTNEPDALNVIVFFTDGLPNTIMADWSTTDGTTLNLRKTTTCSNGTTGSGSSLKYNPVVGYALVDGYNNMLGLFATTLAPPYQPNPASPAGAVISPGTIPTAYVTTASDKYRVGSQLGDSSTREILNVTKSSGCGFTSGLTQDFKQIPTADYYGNLTKSSTQYKPVTLTNFTYSNLVAAAFNAGDYAAQRMRAGVLGSPTAIVPLVDTIALNTGEAPDSVYMKRLANTVDSTNTDAPAVQKTAPIGLYTYAATTADLQPAFVQIASQILHLAQ